MITTAGRELTLARKAHRCTLCGTKIPAGITAGKVQNIAWVLGTALKKEQK